MCMYDVYMKQACRITNVFFIFTVIQIKYNIILYNNIVVSLKFCMILSKVEFPVEWVGSFWLNIYLSTLVLIEKGISIKTRVS